MTNWPFLGLGNEVHGLSFHDILLILTDVWQLSVSAADVEADKSVSYLIPKALTRLCIAAVGTRQRRFDQVFTVRQETHELGWLLVSTTQGTLASQ
jgi:hypothetical protein